MSQHDVLVMGGGHNGLSAAAYMAKAGKKVLVLESKGHYGGGVSTRELIRPGFWHDEHSNVHIMIQGNPMLRIWSRFRSGVTARSYDHTRIWTGPAANWPGGLQTRMRNPIGGLWG